MGGVVGILTVLPTARLRVFARFQSPPEQQRLIEGLLEVSNPPEQTINPIP